MTTAFTILGHVLKERVLTETLRYFLDSNESHDLGDGVFRALAERLGWALPLAPLSVTAISEWTTDKKRKMDVVVVIRESWRAAPLMIVGIEAKLWSKESTNQIADYQDALNQAFKTGEQRLIYLTPNGNPPTTASKHHESICPASPLAWSDIAGIVSDFSSASNTAAEFADHLTLIGRQKQDDETAGAALLTERVLPAVRRQLGLKKNALQPAWNWPRRSAPNEFNFYHLRPSLNDGRSDIIWMFYSPAGAPAIGRQIHLVLMAYSRETCDEQEKGKLEQLRERLPGREGRLFQWDPWQFLWSGGCRTLVDMADQDAAALTGMMARAYSTIHAELGKGIKQLWGHDTAHRQNVPPAKQM